MLTKKQIEAIEIGGRDDEWEMSGDLSMDDARELRRLALLGLERDTRAERIGRAVLRELSDQGVELPGLRDGYASEGGIIAVIAAAMEDEA